MSDTSSDSPEDRGTPPDLTRDLAPDPAPDPAPDLPPAALRALAEAEERRRLAAAQAPKDKEYGGPRGPEPVRYGDWEKKGIAVDF